MVHLDYMAEKMDFKTLAKENRDAELLVKKGGQAALDAAPRLVQAQETGKSEEFRKAALEHVRNFEDARKMLIADLTLALISHDYARARAIFETLERNSVEFYSNSARTEAFKRELDAFVNETLRDWYSDVDVQKIELSMEVTPLTKMDYAGLEENDFAKRGQYTMNPDTMEMDFFKQKPEVEIFDMERFIGMSMSEVATAVAEEYGQDYYIPGFEYEKYLLDHPDKVPDKMKDGAMYHFPGSTLYDASGDCSIPRVIWNTSENKLERYQALMRLEWHENSRVVLIKKPKPTPE